MSNAAAASSFYLVPRVVDPGLNNKLAGGSLYQL